MRCCGSVPTLSFDADPDQTVHLYADEFSFAVLQHSPGKGRVGFAHLSFIHSRLHTSQCFSRYSERGF